MHLKIFSGFITDDGYVKCNLMEFNNYRKWIRKVKLDELHRQNRIQSEEEVTKKREMFAQRKLERENDEANVTKKRERKAKEAMMENEKRREMERLAHV